jgi:transcriptional regulator with XRE-family HTH domain
MVTMKDKDALRVAQMLKATVRFKGIPHRVIEREMGLSTGYLSRILSGKVELRIEHVLGVCRAVGLPPAAFFEAAYPSRELDAETARLVAALQELLPADEEAAPRPRLRKAAPAPPPARKPAAQAAKTAPRTATTQLRRLLEAVLSEMQEQDEEAEEA